MTVPKYSVLPIFGKYFSVVTFKRNVQKLNLHLRFSNCSNYSLKNVHLIFTVFLARIYLIKILKNAFSYIFSIDLEDFNKKDAINSFQTIKKLHL